VFVFGTIAFALIGAIGGYQAYHYTESVTFCGETCHVIMKPEHTAYQNSPHARVACTECHVGSGAGWYAKSKLSGLYQVYATIRDIYPRPIPTPIESLRPRRKPVSSATGRQSSSATSFGVSIIICTMTRIRTGR